VTLNDPEHSPVTSSIVYDTESKKVTVRGAMEFPAEIFEYADDIEILDMSHNHFTELPDILADLKNVRIAFFSGNKFTEFPTAFAACKRLEMVGLKSCGIETMGDHVLPPTLRGLILTDNNLEELPDSIGQLSALQKLMLTGNRLSSLPRTMENLKNLELIRIADNALEHAPAWLSALPNLAWYADSENGYNSATPVEDVNIERFEWNDLIIGVKLGQSANNTVHAATLADGSRVAVKIFGQGTMTDGSPNSDIAAALLAGNHPNIIGGLGKLVNTPNGEQGLVMPLVPQEYKTLGYPPNFSDLTRDSYAPGRKFSLEFITNVALDISNALQYLHAQGIMHGDVYAHNILCLPDGKSKLGDFGAASVYDRDSPAEAWREKLDVIGYGRLIEELLQRGKSSETNTASMEQVRHLTELCLGSNIISKPTFAEINQSLQTI
jgi:hypothetical protein